MSDKSRSVSDAGDGAENAQLRRFPNVWRGSEIAAVRTPSVTTGFAELDRELPGGGWPSGALTEILYPRDGMGEIHLLLPALSQLSRQGKRQIWISPPHRLYAPALAQAQIDLSRVTVVDAAQRRDMLWAAEQALRSAACGVVLVWPAAIKDQRPLRYAEVRRLQIAIEGSETLAFLFRPEAECTEASSAALRLGLASTADFRLAVHILKRRGADLEKALLIDVRADLLPEEQRSRGQDNPQFGKKLSSRTDHVMAGHPFPSSSARINIAGELLS